MKNITNNKQEKLSKSSVETLSDIEMAAINGGGFASTITTVFIASLIVRIAHLEGFSAIVGGSLIVITTSIVSSYMTKPEKCACKCKCVK